MRKVYRPCNDEHMTTAPAMTLTTTDVTPFVRIAPAIFLAPVQDETVEILARCAPHITVVQSEKGDYSLLTDKPVESTVLTPRQAVEAINDCALDYRGLDDLTALADRLRAGEWRTVSAAVRALADRVKRRSVYHVPTPLDVPQALRAIAAPLVRFVQ